MSVDGRLIDVVARLDDIAERVERLETLEFGTLAFPSGGGLGIVCDKRVLVATTTVTCNLPPGRRHLAAIVAAGIDVVGATPAAKIEVTINGIGAGYQYETREERLFVLGDSQAASVGAGAAFWETIAPSRRQFFSSAFKQQCSWLMVLPDPDRMADILDSIDASWIGGNRSRSTGPLVLGISEDADLGGGFQPTDAAITSITWTSPGGIPFIVGSRFTVYGL